MPKTRTLPDLRIRNVLFTERDVIWDLNIFLYRGASSLNARAVQSAISSGELGGPILERLEVIVPIHEYLCGLAAGGEPRVTTQSRIVCLKSFFQFIDRDDLTLTLETLEFCYFAWIDFLVYRTKKRRADVPRNKKGGTGRIQLSSVRSIVSCVSIAFDEVLKRPTKISQRKIIPAEGKRKSAVGVQAEKQNLSDTFEFGHMLQDICDALTTDVIENSILPLEIVLRDGRKFHAACAWQDKSKTRNSNLTVARNRLANIRMEAEIEMFIAQTGLNLAQAFNMELRHFFYSSHLDGYQVKDHKGRRSGAVLFEIFKDYKAHFERYLKWRKRCFPASTRLFPFYATAGHGAGYRFTGYRLRDICKEVGIKFIGPQALRNTRVNWLLRESGSPELTAEMAQHSQKTLLTVYHRPSLQRAITESHNFWIEYDPHPHKARFTSTSEIDSQGPAAGPGSCVGEAKKIRDAPDEAPDPDCMKKSGCLWCNAHRDIDTFKYVWALVTFRHLKLIEISKAPLFIEKSDKPVAARLTLERIDSRIAWFESSTRIREEWVLEARELVLSGEYHEDYADLVNLLEGNQ